MMEMLTLKNRRPSAQPDCSQVVAEHPEVLPSSTVQLEGCLLAAS
jgi:hypothetical protein